MERTQINNSPVEILSMCKRFSMPTLIEEIKFVILVKHEFEYRKKN